ncbi:MAG: hypothetical protein WC979_05070 [Candidatus Pacearchaeota archaeon]|jgi:hypothetical protein
MIKRLLFFLIVLLVIHSVNAGSIGMTPTGSKLFFEPNLEKTFSFRAMTPDPEQRIEMFVKGDLAQYATLSKNSSIGGGAFEVRIKLPEKIEIPGNHRLLVGAIESLNADGAGIGGLASIQVPIDVFVPYPGQYAEALFKLENVNKGNDSMYELSINNLGTQDLFVTATIDIYGEKIKENKVKSKFINIGIIKSKEVFNDAGFLNVSFLEPGIYPVLVTIDYGKKINLENELKIGYLFINLTDYSYIFETNKINKFNIEIENLWNSKISDVYSEVIITDEGVVLDTFTTPSYSIQPWQKVNLTGFFDATNLSEGKYIANIRIFYESQMSSKLVSIYLKSFSKNNLWLIIIGVITIIFIISLGIIIYLELKIKKVAQGAKKKNKK